jgi:hypothetical protein
MDKNNMQEQRGQKDNDTPIYLTSDSTLQTPEEHKHDETVDPTKDTTIEVSNDDLRETETDRIRTEMPDSGNDDNS